ncbi:MAG TPA: hypothetical protein VMD05_07800 [Candidatus Nanoarchaeia archaeon]|nr:hypothetical protein [Candidatus Nanoarchaeia archaeon]
MSESEEALNSSAITLEKILRKSKQPLKISKKLGIRKTDVEVDWGDLNPCRSDNFTAQPPSFVNLTKNVEINQLEQQTIPYPQCGKITPKSRLDRNYPAKTFVPGMWRGKSFRDGFRSDEVQCYLRRDCSGRFFVIVRGIRPPLCSGSFNRIFPFLSKKWS